MRARLAAGRTSRAASSVLGRHPKPPPPSSAGAARSFSASAKAASPTSPVSARSETITSFASAVRPSSFKRPASANTCLFAGVPIIMEASFTPGREEISFEMRIRATESR